MLEIARYNYLKFFNDFEIHILQTFLRQASLLLQDFLTRMSTALIPFGDKHFSCTSETSLRSLWASLSRLSRMMRKKKMSVSGKRRYSTWVTFVMETSMIFPLSLRGKTYGTSPTPDPHQLLFSRHLLWLMHFSDVMRPCFQSWRSAWMSWCPVQRRRKQWENWPFCEVSDAFKREKSSWQHKSTGSSWVNLVLEDLSVTNEHMTSCQWCLVRTFACALDF